MNCRRVNSLISSYIDGELAGVEMLAVKRHLSNCPTCTEEYESLRRVKRLMGRLATVSPSEGFAEVICARLDGYRVPAYHRLWNTLVAYGRSRFNPALAALGAVGVGLVLLTAGSIGNNRTDIVTTLRSPAVAIRPVFDSAIGARVVTMAESPVIPAESSSSPIWYSGFQYPPR